MIDIIITFIAAEGLPALVLLMRIQKTGLSGDAGVFTALTGLGHGSPLAGLICLMLLQLLAIGLAINGILVFFHLKYRKVYGSSEAVAETLEELRSLPLSGMTRGMIASHVIREYARCVHEERRRDGRE